MTTSTPPDIIIEESAFQIIHIIDQQQTLDVKHHARVFESSDITDSGWAIGHRPSDRSIYAFMTTEGLLHAGVTILLTKYCPSWTPRVWELVTITMDGANVAHNAKMGVSVRF